jgi:hypothetical protein
MDGSRFVRGRVLVTLAVLAVALAVLVLPAFAEWNEQVLYSFQGGNSDGAVPVGGMVFDKAGNLYGATEQGGGQCVPLGCGIVFELTPPAQQGNPWTETVLYIFKGVTQSTTDGALPVGGLVMDKSGNLYGTTGYGGTGDCVLLGTKVGCGTIYEMSPPTQKGASWTETILYSFQSGADGYLPQGDLVFDPAGNLYGATVYGGGYGVCNAPYYQYCGTIFRLHPPKVKGGKWAEEVLYAFKGGTKGKDDGDGAEPNGGLVLDSKGAIYGTTFYGGNEVGECAGGDTGVGCGTVFELSPQGTMCGSWSAKILHRFQNGSDSTNPAAGPTLRDGQLYGTTIGTVFRLEQPPSGKTNWLETILYEFNSEAWGPEDQLALDGVGNLYGTTYSSQQFSGTVFRLNSPRKGGKEWSFDLLYGFTLGLDGGKPSAPVLFDKAGNLYSTTTKGGTSSDGVVFELTQ